jgi:hypothetical protein
MFAAHPEFPLDNRTTLTVHSKLYIHISSRWHAFTLLLNKAQTIHNSTYTLWNHTDLGLLWYVITNVSKEYTSSVLSAELAHSHQNRTSFVTTYQTICCLKQKIAKSPPPLVETSRLMPQYAAGLTELYYAANLQQANIIVIRVIWLSKTSVLHPTTHKVNKVNPAGVMKSGGFM